MSKESPSPGPQRAQHRNQPQSAGRWHRRPRREARGHSPCVSCYLCLYSGFSLLEADMLLCKLVFLVLFSKENSDSSSRSLLQALEEKRGGGCL